MPRVRRIVAVFDVGKIVNEKLARSQFIGGIVWGIGLALHEIAYVDWRSGRIANANLGEYHVPLMRMSARSTCLRSTFRTSISIHWERGESVKSESQEQVPRSPMPCFTPLASACANCRLLRTSCSPDRESFSLN